MKSANDKGANPIQTQQLPQQPIFMQQQQMPFTQHPMHAQSSLASPTAPQ